MRFLARLVAVIRHETAPKRPTAGGPASLTIHEGRP